MKDSEVRTIAQMIESNWSMHVEGSLWRTYLLGQDAELVTKAVAQLARTQTRKPTIADLKGVIGKIKADRATPTVLAPKEDEPPWVKSWRLARENGDYRKFVEQIPALAEMASPLDPVPDEPPTDADVWVQIGEYGYEGCAYDFWAEPDMNRLCAMHPHAPTRQPLKRTVVGTRIFMLCLDCQDRYQDRLRDEMVQPPHAA